jgi:cytochrome c556
MGKLTHFVAGAVILGALIAGMSGPVVALEGVAAIEARVKFMKNDILGPFKVIKGYVKKGMGSAADVAAAARKINAVATKIPGLFPKGTSRGEFDAKTTRALPKIWQDWKGFEAAAGVLAKESMTLAKTADGGDKAAIGKQFGMMGKMGCGGCHKPFRGAKEK